MSENDPKENGVDVPLSPAPGKSAMKELVEGTLHTTAIGDTDADRIANLGIFSTNQNSGF